jgi:acetyltransferase-like isoleucine patch superfamily enzyme
MIRKLIIKYLRTSSIERGKHVRLWRKFGSPSLDDWTEYVRRHGGLHEIGDNCAINPSVVFTDPYITQIGSNVRIAGGIIMGHDGSINMINRYHNSKFDAIGPVIISDNVFIGIGCIILAGAKIGANTIIGAGSVVSGRIEGDGVYAGNPLRRIRSMDEHIEKLAKRNANYPWRAMIEAREGGYDPVIEPELKRQRIGHFFRD